MKRITKQEYMELLGINRYRVKRTKQGYYKLDINKYIKSRNSDDKDKQGIR